MDVKEKVEKYRLLKRHYDLEYWANPLESKAKSDEIYDQVKRTFDELLEQHPEYKLPEDDLLESVYMNTFMQVIHKHKMLSLDKALSFEEYIKWLKPLKIKIKNSKNKKLVYEYKIDGFAITLEYENGILIKASTRGDGKYGNDITATVYLIPDIPKKLPNNITAEFTGEIYMKKSSLMKLNEKLVSEGKKPLKNVRNSAAGIGRTKDASSRVSEYLNFYCYGYYNDEHEYDSYIDEMDYVNSLGFNTVFHDLDGILIDDIDSLSEDELKELFKKFEDKRELLDLDIDGIVIKINDKLLQMELGEKLKVSNWAIAYKFPAIEKLTTILDIEWDYGAKDRRFTPMAVIEPVDIGGTTVKRPTLHNWNKIQELGAKIGCTAIVSRRGDVIPHIEEIIHELTPEDVKEVELPICPYCNSKTIVLGTYVKCPNDECDGQINGQLRIFVRAMEIDNLGINTIDKLINNEKIQSISDIYKLKSDDFIEIDKMGEKLSSKILNNIEKSKKQTLWKILLGLSIPSVGEKAARTLENYCNNLTNFLNLTMDDLNDIDNIGEVSSNKIINWLNNDSNKNLIQELINIGLGNIIEKVEVEENKLNGLKISFTGKLNTYSRNECEKVIEKNGGVIWGIKKEIDILLIGNGAKDHKINKAKELGAKIITEEEFLDMIK